MKKHSFAKKSILLILISTSINAGLFSQTCLFLLSKIVKHSISSAQVSFGGYSRNNRRGHTSKRPHRKKKIRATISSKENQAQSIEKTAYHLECYRSKNCSDDIDKIMPGLKKLPFAYQNGSKYAELIISIYKNASFYGIPHNFSDLIKYCTNLNHDQLQCTPYQFIALEKILNLHWDERVHKNFFMRIIRQAGKHKNRHDLDSMFSFIQDLENSKRKGRIRGNFKEITHDGSKFILENGDSRSLSQPDLLGLYRENKAIKLLSELGYTINILGESKREKLMQGIQHKFEQIRIADKLPKSKNPDVLINERFIADIYSPNGSVDHTASTRIARRILIKSESTDFKAKVPIEGDPKRIKTETIQGGRQTNRVIVFVDDYDDDNPIEFLIDDIRNEIGLRAPRHLTEAFLLFETSKGPQIRSVWP